MASTYLTRTPGTGQTSRYKGTLSVWVKRAKTDEEDFIFYGFEASANRMKITFLANGKLQINSIQAGSNHLVYETNRLFRDVSAWYHIVIGIDTTLATAGDRCRLYVNGVEETSFSTETHFSQNDLHFLTENNIPVYIGSQASGNYFDGCMAHYHLIDGTQYDADDFGETDSTTGIWKPKTSPSVTYGSHGFFLDFADSSAMGNDISGNNNDLTVSGTMTQTIDTPSNVFATLDKHFPGSTGFTFEHGNTTVTTEVSAYKYALTTLGMSKGKYYCEVKNVNHPTNTNNDHYNRIGITPGLFNPGSTHQLGKGAKEYSIIEVDGKIENNNTTTAYGTGYSTDGDIVGVALDLDNNKIYFSKNGTWMNSADPSAGTGGYSIDAASTTDSGFYHFAVGEGGSSLSSKFSINFGNGFFGTTAVASAGTNSGIGTFEYDVPTGFKALCTKSINEQEYS